MIILFKYVMPKCKHCKHVRDDSHFKSKVNRRTKPTANCLKCRDSITRSNKNPTTKVGKCREFWRQWKASHSCPCGITDPRLLEADHLSKKVHKCSDYAWWSCHGGVPAMELELATCQCLCKFCHRLKTKAERKTCTNVTYLAKRAIINAEKLRRGSCLQCQRKVTIDTVCAFDFDHNPKYQRMRLSQMVKKSWPYFNAHSQDELAGCNLLCCNCHKIKTLK